MNLVRTARKRFSAASRVNMPTPQQAFNVTTWQSGHGWTALGGGTIDLNHTTAGEFDPAFGTQCVSVTTLGAGATTGFRRSTLPSAVNFTNALPRLRFKILTDPAKLTTFQIDIGDTAFTNFTRFDFSEIATTPRWYTQNVWDVRTWDWDTFPGFISVTGSPNKAAVTSMQVRVADNATGAVQILFQQWDAVTKQTLYPNGVVTFSFDDSYGSQYTYAYPIAQARGVGCVACLIADYTKLSSPAGKLTWQQLHAMQEAGWQISGHSMTDANHTLNLDGQAPADARRETMAWQNWLRGSGFDGWRHMSYPHGRYNQFAAITPYNVPAFLRQQGVMTARSVDSHWRENGVAPVDPMRMNAIVLGLPRTLAQAKAAVDQCKVNANWLVFYGHDLVAGAASTSNEWNQQDFADLVDYCQAQGVAIKTEMELFRL